MGFLFLEKRVIWCFVILSILVASIKVQGSLEGYISLDCGIPDNYVYKDNTTGIDYISDYKFIGTGTNYSIASIYINSALPKQVLTVRSFPEGRRNCYTLESAVQDNKYLLRATFMYGNYDNKDSVQPGNPVQFDLHIGVNLWKTVNISDASLTYTVEAIIVALGNFISVCLINTDHGTPFISSLEMRELKNQTYPLANASQSLVLFQRVNMGIKTNQIIRYPDDPYDRVWWPLREDPSWTEISTNLTVANYKNDDFDGPSAVLQTAAMQANLVNSTSIAFSWDAVDVSEEYFTVFYFSELETLGGNGVRMFSINYSGSLWFGPFSPPYLLSNYIYSVGFFTGQPRYNFSLHATVNSTHPPLMNAREIYTRMQLQEVMTNLSDFDAIMAIKGAYQLKKNWMGDPCRPMKYAWDGLQCNYGVNPPTITAVNLSSSGLVGEISSSFSKLQTLNYLDLSYNNLTGAIPEILANISSLEVLNLTGNNFTGDIPDALKRKANDGALILKNLTGNNFTGDIPDALKRKANDGALILKVDITISPTPNNSTESAKNKISTPIIMTLAVVPVLLLLVIVVLIMLLLRRRTPASELSGPSVGPPMETSFGENMDHKDCQMQVESRQFTAMQLVNITKNTKVIGRGGFGVVSHGYLEDGTEVAVKLCSQDSLQGAKQFLAEAKNLTKVHHRNLVSLVGYCKDGDCLALVYEYMPLGSLQDHLRGKTGVARALSWRERVQIAFEAAKGLDYLHNGCNPPIIHRDVKTSNILLGEKLEAKIVDFGLSKVSGGNAYTQTQLPSMSIVGTPGYIDPESHRSLKLDEKSDVYSFGVVLLEMITGEPPIMPGPDNIHIVRRVAAKVARGNIKDITDARLQEDYDTNSLWNVVDIAMRCTDLASAKRPAMTEVVKHLAESLELEIAWRENISVAGTDVRRSLSVSFAPSLR